MLPLGVFATDRSIQLNDNGKDFNFNKVTSIEFFGWKSDLDGDVNVDGLVVDLDSDANFDEENRFGFRINHVLSKKGRVSLSYAKHDHSGTINKTVTFKNQNYNAGANTQIETSWFDVTYAHMIGWGRFNDPEKPDNSYLDALVGVKISDSSINVTGFQPVTNARLENSWSETFPIPYIGLAGGTMLSKHFWLNGQIKYMNVNASGNDVKHFDYGIKASYQINQKHDDTQWFVELGYRNVKFDGESDNDKANFSYSGPTLGISARF